MSAPNLSQIATQLESPSLKDRLLALVALREVAPDQAVPLIKKVLNDESLQIRSMAIFALGLKPTEECFPLLVRLLEGDPDYGIRADAAGALGYLGDIRAVESLIHALYEDTDWLVRFSAAVSLGNLRDPRADAALIQALQSSETVIQQAAIAALGEIGAVHALPQILSFAQSEDWLVRQRLAEALGRLPSSQTLAALRHLCRDTSAQVVTAAVYSLANLLRVQSDTDVAAELLHLIQSEEWQTRLQLLEAVLALNLPETPALAKQLAADPNPFVALTATQALAQTA